MTLLLCIVLVGAACGLLLWAFEPDAVVRIKRPGDDITPNLIHRERRP